MVVVRSGCDERHPTDEIEDRFFEIYKQAVGMKMTEQEQKINQLLIDLDIAKRDIKYIEDQLAELKDEPERWEPKGIGDYHIYGDGVVHRQATSKTYINFGTERPTKELAQKARDAMYKHNRLLAYVHEHAPDYEPVWDGEQFNYCVYYDSCKREWRTEYARFHHTPTTVYMPREVAEQLVEKLNEFGSEYLWGEEG